jgi:L-alanine-DL-glutamate epimerase-like enolase superfamily enzyme
MQILKCEVVPVDLKLASPVHLAELPEITHMMAIFIRIETKDGRNAYGCSVAHPALTMEKPEQVLHTCQECAALVPDLHPVNIEYSLSRIASLAKNSPAVMCAFDLAFHDLLGLAAGLPLYRLLGGFRNQVQTSITIPLAPQKNSVELAKEYASKGFRKLKIKGGLHPEEDVSRVRAIHRALPDHILRLDADGGYSVEQALDVARALQAELEMLEQPVSADDLDGLAQVTHHSPVPVLADQSVRGPASALELASNRRVSGMSVKVSTCGGLQCARQVDSISRAARLATMVGCLIEPALLIAAGLSLALSSPNVRYCDLDGNLGITNDPTVAGFKLENGCLTASEVPGLGCTVNLD